MLCILQGIYLSGQVKQIMTNYLRQKSYEDTVDILSRIICRLLPDTYVVEMIWYICLSNIITTVQETICYI